MKLLSSLIVVLSVFSFAQAKTKSDKRNPAQFGNVDTFLNAQGKNVVSNVKIENVAICAAACQSEYLDTHGVGNPRLIGKIYYAYVKPTNSVLSNVKECLGEAKELNIYSLGSTKEPEACVQALTGRIGGSVDLLSGDKVKATDEGVEVLFSIQPRKQ